MGETLLELIKTRTLYLQEGIPSSELVLVDDIGGDMYFRFLLKYVSGESQEKTNFQVLDEFHAQFTIVTSQPHYLTRLSVPLEIGTYQKNRALYLDVVVEPTLAPDDNTHKVTVSFYTDRVKKQDNGVN